MALRSRTTAQKSGVTQAGGINVSATAGQAQGERGLAERLGLKPGQVVQEIGWDEEVADEVRDSIEDLTGNELLDEEADDVVDVVLLWWREGDGDLFHVL